MYAFRLHGLFAAALVLSAGAASAGSLSGTVQSEGGQPLQNIQVRLWAPGAKGYTVAKTALTDSLGVYAIGGIDAGTYKLNARMGPGVSGNYGDRWYDVAAPTSDGYVGADADLITVGELDVLGGFDFTLQILGGFDGQVTVGGNPAVDMRVRGERAGQPAIHHNDLTQSGPHAGRFYMRGMVPGGDYRFIIHDANGIRETLVSEGPHVAFSGANTALPAFALAPAGVDPNEPNNGPLTAVDVDEAVFAGAPAGTYTSSDGRIAPRSAGDTDWYCWDVNDGERFIIEATSPLALTAGARANPFVDPVVGLFTGDGTTKLAEDDDSGPGLASLLDTGLLAAGRYCAVVTMYGDTLFDGQNQTTAGAFTLTINMGNRRPLLSGTVGTSPLPAPPLSVELDEGTGVTFDFTWSDPDLDVLMANAVFVDNAGAPVAGAAFAPGAGGGSWSWTASQIAAQGSPYELTVTVQDAEFTETVVVVVEVNEINLPPSTPVHDAPDDGTTVGTATPSLVVQNAVDPDGDVLQYEFELYFGAAQTPVQTELVMEGAGGLTSFVPAAIPENTEVRWRARAYDGHANNPYSPWSTEWTFFVDVQNDPPTAPTLLKPEEAEVVMVKRPALSASHPVDPEDDALTLHFELATDAQFTQGLIESPPLALNGAGTSTTWNVPGDLPWGSSWFARAYARDDRGGQSDYSNVNRFGIKPNAPPSVPELGTPFLPLCDGLVSAEKVTQVLVGPSTDPEDEGVSLQLIVVPFDGNPETATPLFNETKEQPGNDPVSFDVSGVALAEDTRYRFRARAWDGIDFSQWAECSVTQDLEETVDPGGGGGNGGGGTDVKKGCGCSAADPSLALLGLLGAAAFLGRRRRLPGARA